MKRIFQIVLLLSGFAAFPAAAYEAPAFPFSPAAGEPGSTAVWNADPLFRGWATSVSIQYGSEVAEEWKTPEAALGASSLNDHDVVVLGRGGMAVLGFEPAIRDGEGFDFALFENSFSGTFLVLAYVEVSSDGEHFVRFPNYSLTAGPVGGFGVLQPEFIEGFAGKHAGGYGTPFDLAELAAVHAALQQGYDRFSAEYATAFLENFPYLDPGAVRHVRIVDIPGDGTRLDCEGFPIYDPYPTIITAGFDLDAAGVMNQATIPVVPFADWSSQAGLPAEAKADTDGDGWPQYMEYLFASDPRDPDDRPAVVQQLEAAGSLTLLFWRSLSAETKLEIHYTQDGANWLEAGPVLNLETRVSGGQALALDQLTLPMEGGAVLVRFVSLPL